MSDLKTMSDAELTEWTAERLGIAIRLHPRSRDQVKFWSLAYDCRDEWNRRGQPERYLEIEKSEREGRSR
jgi:hypothetical protein